MPGLLVAVLLIASLLLVHFSMRSRPMPKDCPLNVDDGLPLPEAGQASTVFSLTALFGAYFGIYLMLGMPALAGLAFGTVGGLVLTRYWINQTECRTFEEFLQTILKGNNGNVFIFVLSISGIQLAYATSELLILREIARVSLGVRADQATLVAIGVGIIGYFYVLFGGYMAVFRTDVLQFVLVTAMAAAVSFISFQHSPGGWVLNTSPRSGYWKLPFDSPRYFLYAYHFIIGAVMGTGFLAACPDAWKRVFLVTKVKTRTRLRFLTLVCIGAVPFLILLPLALISSPIQDGIVDVGKMFSGLLASDFVFVAASLGLVASFLSSFDSALLAGVHLTLIMQRNRSPVTSELSRFHWLMVVGFVTIFFLFKAMILFGNPYLLANFLLGPFAIIAGIQIGTRGSLSRLRENALLWVIVVGLLAWFLYFNVRVGFPQIPTTYEVNAVPGGVMLFFLIAFVCQVLATGGRKHA